MNTLDLEDVHQVFIPHSPLKYFVDFIWVGNAQCIELEANTPAELFTELIFNYGDQFEIDGQNIANDQFTHQQHILSGLKTTPFQTKVSGTYRNIGLILKPFCYGLLIHQLGTPKLKSIGNLLYEIFFQSDHPNIELAESSLLQLFQAFEKDRDIEKFDQQISAQFLKKGALKSFNSAIKISQKSFIHKFKQLYQLTPNQYVKLKQFHYAIHLMKQSQFTNLTDLGLSSGFYDQSHFIKIFKRFSGCTPKQFYSTLLNDSPKLD